MHCGCNATFTIKSLYISYSPYGATNPIVSGSPNYRGFTITLKNTTLGRTPQPDAETSTGKHTTLRRERHSWPRRDSNQQSQQMNGRRSTPWRAAIRIGVALNSYLQFFGSTQTTLAEGFRNFPQSPKVISDNTSTQAMAISFHIFYRSLSFNATSTEILNIKYQKISCGWVKTQQCCVLTHPPDIFWYLIL